MRYAAKKSAQPYDEHGNLRCDRCGRVAQPWPLQRPDNCGTTHPDSPCWRTFNAILAGWDRERAKQAQKAAA